MYAFLYSVIHDHMVKVSSRLSFSVSPNQKKVSGIKKKKFGKSLNPRMHKLTDVPSGNKGVWMENIFISVCFRSLKIYFRQLRCVSL